VVYLSESPALALLEVLVHFELQSGDVPDSYQLLEVACDARSGLSRLAESALPGDWRRREEVTRAVGDEWLATQKGVLLRVPSAIVPASYNYLFNPRHPLAGEASIEAVIRHPYDRRLLR
jgi:RES domain-containing protein